jgi:hypothetical protein
MLESMQVLFVLSRLIATDAATAAPFESASTLEAAVARLAS